MQEHRQHLAEVKRCLHNSEARRANATLRNHGSAIREPLHELLMDNGIASDLWPNDLAQLFGYSSTYINICYCLVRLTSLLDDTAKRLLDDYELTYAHDDPTERLLNKFMAHIGVSSLRSSRRQSANLSCVPRLVSKWFHLNDDHPCKSPAGLFKSSRPVLFVFRINLRPSCYIFGYQNTFCVDPTLPPPAYLLFHRHLSRWLCTYHVLSGLFVVSQLCTNTFLPCVLGYSMVNTLEVFDLRKRLPWP